MGRGHYTTTLSPVSFPHFRSGRLAPATTQPTGTPWPSVSRLRLTPLLARSGGLGPVVFPPERGLRQRPGHAQPAPIQPLQLVNLFPPAYHSFRTTPAATPAWNRSWAVEWGPKSVASKAPH